MDSLPLPLRDASGHARGSLVVSKLPNGPAIADGSAALMEGQRYRYELQGIRELHGLEPAELFDPDDASRRRGRINTGQYVGTVAIVVRDDANAMLTATVEVLPTKLSQVDEYRQMLTDITTHAAEAVLQGFAPATLAAAPSTGTTTDLLYQRFVVLESQLRSDEFTSAIAQVLCRPHVEWLTTMESQTPGAAYPTGPTFGRALSAPGPRRPWLTDRHRAALATMPARMERRRHETTLDTLPNQFIKHLLETWRALAHQLRDSLANDEDLQPGPIRRGLRAAEEVMEMLDGYLGHPLFREVSRLDRFPMNNQVLHKRDGYRQIFRMSAIVEAGLDLPWTTPGAEDLYSPSSRNAATLYELWSYLKLVEIVGELCGRHQTAHAFAPSANGLSLRLKTGATSALRWQTQRHGRGLEVQLLFNRQFTAGTESWTAPMRPDYSILIRPTGSPPRLAPDSLDVWVHFDAKYRVSDVLPLDLAIEDDDTELPRGTARREDLLKMHAYRDAVYRTAGAYILYPGDVTVDRKQFTETLPGLGAFPLRPASTGPHGVEAISRFLSDVLDHVAEQASQHERERFWRASIYASPVRTHPSLQPVAFLDRPPADTDVLVGYVRGPKHRDWIYRTRMYNVRADDRSGSLRLGGRELSAPLLLLYGRVDSTLEVLQLARIGGWQVADRTTLLRLGYPGPRGRLYLVTTMEELAEPPPWLHDVSIERLRSSDLPLGAPFAATWVDLMASVQYQDHA